MIMTIPIWTNFFLFFFFFLGGGGGGWGGSYQIFVFSVDLFPPFFGLALSSDNNDLAFVWHPFSYSTDDKKPRIASILWGMRRHALGYELPKGGTEE